MSLISAIIITRNEEKMLPGCLKSLAWVDEIVVVDSGSYDKTLEIAQKSSAKVVRIPSNSDYSYSRNQGMKAVSGDWLFYVDADERVSPKLKQEIKQLMQAAAQRVARPLATTPSNCQIISYKMPRQNIMLGKWVKHGGFWPDHVHRLFHRDSLVKWVGKLHESPVTRGEVKFLKNSLTHFTARSIDLALKKSSQWSEIEAKLYLKVKAPRVTWWKVIKAFNIKLFSLLILKKGWLDGIRGFALAYIQAFHQACVLVNLWQLQRRRKSI